MILGQYCYPERAEKTAMTVFSSLKNALSGEDARKFFDLLPEPVSGLWRNASPEGMGDDGPDCIASAQRAGDYPYRAAAERAFEAVFASIREIVDDERKKWIHNMLPPSVRPLFERSKACALDGSAEDFL